MAGELAKYVEEIRRRNIPARRWYWEKNAHRAKPIAYALEYNPITLMMRAARYVKRRRMLAPLMAGNRPSGAMREAGYFRLVRDGRENSYRIFGGNSELPAIERAAALPSGNTKLILFHAYYEEEADEMMGRLEVFTDYDLILTTPVKEIRDKFARRFDPKRAASFLVKNEGRDVLPMLLVLAFADLSRYRHFVKVHTKRSLHHLSASEWYNANIEMLIGNREMTDKMLELIDPARPEIFGVECKTLGDHYRNNRQWLEHVMGGKVDSGAKFIPGTMFAGSGEFLRRLALEKLHLHVFEEEGGQLDGCLVHALERYFGYFASSAGGECNSVDELLVREGQD